MPLHLALIVFPFALAAIIAGSLWLSRGIDAIGTRFSMLPGLLGLITALGSDSPEIFSAVTALFAGEHEVGIGVVLGSNLFNLAALMGLSGLLSEDLPLKRPVVLFNGAVSLLETGVATLLVLHLLTPAVSMALLGAIFAAYVLVLWVRGDTVERLPIPPRAARWLATLVEDVHTHANRKDGEEKPAESGDKARDGWPLWATIGASLLLIVAGSFAMVHSALGMFTAWAIPKSLVGALVLAALTGIPNTYTSIWLALRGKGAAVVSETLNSNTINIVVGIGLPALVFGVSRTRIGLFELWWLLGLTAVSVLLAALGKGLSRWNGMVIVVLYLVFVAMRVYLQ
ncbi:MAG TPA: hypothetical protein VKA48_04595 [Gammaproteobacteria bacterium]|nr:hypothetical protein [Gammaproteobacteria bacterium]